jgi:hypothetical protein
MSDYFTGSNLIIALEFLKESSQNYCAMNHKGILEKCRSWLHKSVFSVMLPISHNSLGGPCTSSSKIKFGRKSCVLHSYCCLHESIP